MRKNKIILLNFLLMLMVTTTLLGIEITPSSFVYDLDSTGLTQDVVFYNRKDRPERVRVSFKPYGKDGENKYLGKWGTIYPKIITVGPDEQKTVKFSIEPPGNIPAGEYRALLFMEELEQKALNNVDGKVTLKNGNVTQINMLINLGVVVYGYGGNRDALKVSGEVTNVKLGKSKLSFTLKNNGEITKPYVLVYEGINKKNGKPIVETENLIVVQGYSENIDKELPKGINVKKIYVKDSKNTILKTIM